MKNWQTALLGLTITVGLGIAIGQVLRVFRASQLVQTTATVLETETRTVSFTEDPYGPSRPVNRTKVKVTYNVQDRAYTSEVSSAFRVLHLKKGSTLKILYNKHDPSVVELGE